MMGYFTSRYDEGRKAKMLFDFAACPWQLYEADLIPA